MPVAPTFGAQLVDVGDFKEAVGTLRATEVVRAELV